MEEQLLTSVKETASEWLSDRFDQDTQQEVRYLLENNEQELVDAFYKDLEFGTGGLRGIMGAGTNRMNSYTVGMATQGLCNYLKKQFPERQEIKVAIAYDSRNNSRIFAESTAKIFAANHIKAYLFDDLRPTPELSYAIRQLGCQSGVVITASHNPKAYNGYKVYWEDGGQVVAPHDQNIIEEVRKITSVDQIRFEADEQYIQTIGKELDQQYLDDISQLSLNPSVIQEHKNLKIVFTPLHGSSVDLVPRILKKIGFENIYVVEEQATADGNFPTVESPNPEEEAALDLAIQKAKEVDADLVMGTDPDGDRVGIAVKDHRGEYSLLNGNQTGALLINYVLSQLYQQDRLTGNDFIVKTIVTTELLADIAQNYDVAYFDVYTGFKHIANLIRQYEGQKQFLAGGEESYGYLVGDFVRDKDATIACAMIAEIFAWCKHHQSSLFDQLLNLYAKHGLYKERLMSLKREGKEGAEEIKRMMKTYRETPPHTINQSKIVKIHDYWQGTTTDRENNSSYPIDFPPSDVLQFILDDGTKISMRPSGTEPKIKFYFSVKQMLPNKEDFETVNQQLENRIEQMRQIFEI